MKALAPLALVLGLGSPHGDDQAGWLVVDGLRARGRGRARKVGNGVELLQAMHGKPAVVIVDASAPSGRPGRVRWFDWPAEDPSVTNPVSTHAFSLIDALRMADSLGAGPQCVTVITIEAGTETPGDAVSEPVVRAIEHVIQALQAVELPRPT